MDTDDLTPMAYEMLSLAYEAFEAVRSEIGESASRFRDEDAFLRGTAAFMQDILDDPGDYLEYWNALDQIEMSTFVVRVQSVLAHIDRTLNTPRKERGKPPFEA